MGAVLSNVKRCFSRDLWESILSFLPRVKDSPDPYIDDIDIMIGAMPIVKDDVK